MEIIVLLGPPGSGKGTQAQMIKEKSGYPIISSSKLIREKFKQYSPSEDPRIKKAKTQYKEGELVDPNLFADWTLEIVEDIKKDPQKKDGVIFDGFLRTLKETKIVLPKLIDKFGPNSIKAFFLKISLSEAQRRLSTRLICSKCNKPLKPDSELGVGDRCPYKGCSGKITKRELDKADIIKQRFNSYKKQTKPSIDYLEKKEILNQIDGSRSVEGVNEDIMGKINHEK